MESEPRSLKLCSFTAPSSIHTFTQDTAPLHPHDALSIERKDRVMVDAPAPMSPSSAESPPMRKNRQPRECKTAIAQRPPPSMDLFDPHRYGASKPLGGHQNHGGRERRAMMHHGAAPVQNPARGDKKSSVVQRPSRKQRQDAPPSTPAPPLILKHEPGGVSMQRQTSPNQLKFAGSKDDDDENAEMIRQPETRPISQDQLVAEVKGIYAGLVMVEAKCIEVDTKQAQVAMKMESDKSIAQPRLNNEQWQALIALHRTLLHEHHDFLLASQHPSVRILASKYAMPARMWRHGIHSFLELLRHRLPASFEHMLTFIYLAYSMMALLYETIPAFADTWVECLGDLSRYRMAIEEGDVRDREVWTNVSRFWYSKGADRTPSVGRLYHHLAILSRPYILQQIFYYSKSLTVGSPFLSARESIITLFDPAIIRSQKGGNDKSQTTDLAFIKVHSLLFQAINVDAYDAEKGNYHDLLDKRTGELETQFKIQGVYVAICNIAAIWQYGSKTAQMKLHCKDREEPKPDGDAVKEEPVEVKFLSADVPKRVTKIKLYTEGSAAEIALQNSIDFAMSTMELILDRKNDSNCHPHILVFFALFNHLMEYPEATAITVDYVPWKSLVETLNLLMAKKEEKNYPRILDSANFPVNERSIGRLLSEDFLLRGLDITKQCFPPSYSQRVQVDDEERFQELPSFVMVREERLLWLMIRLAKYGPWTNFDQETDSFSEIEDATAVHRDEVRELLSRLVMQQEDLDGNGIDADATLDVLGTVPPQTGEGLEKGKPEPLTLKKVEKANMPKSASSTESIVEIEATISEKQAMASTTEATEIDKAPDVKSLASMPSRVHFFLWLENVKIYISACILRFTHDYDIKESRSSWSKLKPRRKVHTARTCPVLSILSCFFLLFPVVQGLHEVAVQNPNNQATFGLQTACFFIPLVFSKGVRRYIMDIIMILMWVMALAWLYIAYNEDADDRLRLIVVGTWLITTPVWLFNKLRKSVIGQMKWFATAIVGIVALLIDFLLQSLQKGTEGFVTFFPLSVNFAATILVVLSTRSKMNHLETELDLEGQSAIQIEPAGLAGSHDDAGRAEASGRVGV